MADFDAARSRAKRPCPVWVDAFLRDTQHLEADEVGGYFLILMAMWIRPECDLPNDDARLARISRVSPKLWKSRIGPALLPFFAVENGCLISKRLREEAGYVEDMCRKQSDRKTNSFPKSDPTAKPEGKANSIRDNGINSDKPLKNNKQASTTDATTDSSTDQPRHHPSQQPNIRSSSVVSGADARSPDPQPDQAPPEPPMLPVTSLPEDAWALWRQIVRASGLAEERLPGNWMPPAAVMHVQRWLGLGLSEQEVIDTARQIRSNFHDPPNGPKALDWHMHRTAVAKQIPAFTPPDQPKPRMIGGPNAQRDRTIADRTEDRAAILRAAARGTT